MKPAETVVRPRPPFPLAWLVAILLPATAAWGCPAPRQAVVTQRAAIRLGAGTVVATAASLPDPNNHQVRLLVTDSRCRALWDETEDGAEARFARRRLGGAPLLEFVVMRPAGDGTGYVHEVLVRRGGRLVPALPPVFHTGKDGFFLGRLAGGGEGAVAWIADPSGEAEAAAHPYVVTTWRWRAGRFGAPRSTETARAYLPSDTVVPRGDMVARAMGLPYRDQTGTDRFMAYGKLLARLDALERQGD